MFSRNKVRKLYQYSTKFQSSSDELCRERNFHPYQLFSKKILQLITQQTLVAADNVGLRWVETSNEGRWKYRRRFWTDITLLENHCQFDIEFALVKRCLETDGNWTSIWGRENAVKKLLSIRRRFQASETLFKNQRRFDIIFGLAKCRKNITVDPTLVSGYQNAVGKLTSIRCRFWVGKTPQKNCLRSDVGFRQVKRCLKTNVDSTSFFDRQNAVRILQLIRR